MNGSSRRSELIAWLDQQPNMAVLRMPYTDVLADPEAATRRISEFLGGKPDPSAMARATEPEKLAAGFVQVLRTKPVPARAAG